MSNIKNKLSEFILPPKPCRTAEPDQGDPVQVPESTYYERNHHWMNSLFAVLLLIWTSAILTILGIDSPLPQGFTLGGGAVAMLSVGIGVMRTDTVSAHAIRCLAVPVAGLAALYFLLK